MRIATLTFLLTLIFSGAAGAQSPTDDFNAYLGLGTGLPQNPDSFKDNWDFGLSASFTAALGIPGSDGLFVAGKAQYHLFPNGYEDQIGSGAGNDGIDQSILLVGVDGMVVLGESQRKAQPFFGIGLGMANISYSNASYNDSTVVSLEGETNMYANAFFGIDVDISPKIGLFGQVGYVWINTDEDATMLVPIIVGVRL